MELGSSGTEAAASYGPFVDQLKGLRRHFSFASIGEKARSLLERQPFRLSDLVAELVRDVAEPSTAVAHEEEAHHFEDALPPPCVDVADVAELYHQASAHPGFLGHLAERGVGRRLTLPDKPLR